MNFPPIASHVAYFQVHSVLLTNVFAHESVNLIPSKGEVFLALKVDCHRNDEHIMLHIWRHTGG